MKNETTNEESSPSSLEDDEPLPYPTLKSPQTRQKLHKFVEDKQHAHKVSSISLQAKDLTPEAQTRKNVREKLSLEIILGFLEMH